MEEADKVDREILKKYKVYPLWLTFDPHIHYLYVESYRSYIDYRKYIPPVRTIQKYGGAWNFVRMADNHYVAYSYYIQDEERKNLESYCICRNCLFGLDTPVKARCIKQDMSCSNYVNIGRAINVRNIANMFSKRKK